MDNRVVEELQVISGTFNAEYGQAMSGIVNIVTKEGGAEFHGAVSSEFGDYLSTHDNLFLNIDEVSPTAIQDYTASLFGPVPLVPRTELLCQRALPAGQRLALRPAALGRWHGRWWRRIRGLRPSLSTGTTAWWR